MALGVLLLVIVACAVVAAGMDWRTRRKGHRVPSGRDLNRRIPRGTDDNSNYLGRPTTVLRPDNPDPRSERR